MNNQLILLETIRDFSAGISQQQDHINLDNLVNPLIPNPDVNNFFDFIYEYFELVNYDPWPYIAGKVSV